MKYQEGASPGMDISSMFSTLLTVTVRGDIRSEENSGERAEGGESCCLQQGLREALTKK